MSGTARRVGAIMLRHFFLWRGSWTRLFDLVYWPVLQVMIWGFMTEFLAGKSSWVAQAGGVFIGAVLLWDVLVRGQFGMTLSMLEEMWSRNLANLFVSPLRPWEFAVALMSLSILRSLIGVVPAALLAIPLFGYSVFGLGLPLLAFWSLLLVFGWAIGLALCGLLLRFGLAAESYAWASVFLLAPFSGVYYPVATLPGWLQPLAWCLPTTHVFEGMRAAMVDGTFRWELMLGALALDLACIAAGFAIFLGAVASARRRGSLLSTGE
ncbi:MAG: ABC transporter permease [Alphaproteobacteria bacterium]|jgi:ABC-2 type transport system permease protein